MNVNDQVAALLERSRYIRAVGPTTEDFMRWRDAAEELLTDVVGEVHPAMSNFHAAIGPRERLDAEGLQIHGQYGMSPRLIAAEDVLRGLVSS